MAAQRRAEGHAWDKEEEAVRCHILEELGPALSAKVTDTMMVRFVRGYYYEEPRAEKTAAILRETLEWRERMGVDNLIDAPDELLVQQSLDYHDLFHLDIYGRDNTGHVIMCHEVGRIEPQRLLSELDMTAIKRHFIRDIEYLCLRKDRCGMQLGSPRYKHVSVIDLSGFSRKHMGSNFRGPMKEVLDQLQAYYPESVKKVYIINAPFIFRGLWSIVKPWLHPNTQAAIEICSSKHMEMFEENGISRDSLPVSLGGTMATGELHAYFSAGCKLPKDLAVQRKQEQQEQQEQEQEQEQEQQQQQQQQQEEEEEEEKEEKEGPRVVSSIVQAEAGDTEGLLPPARRATGEGNHLQAHEAEDEGLLPGLEPEPEPEPEQEVAPDNGARSGMALELDVERTQAMGQEVDYEDTDSIRTPETGYLTPQAYFPHRQQDTEAVQQNERQSSSAEANSNGADDETFVGRKRRVSFGGWHQPPVDASADGHSPEVVGHNLGFGSPFAQPAPPLPSPVELLHGNGRAFAPEVPEGPKAKRTADSPRRGAPRRNRKQRGWGCCGAPSR